MKTDTGNKILAYIKEKGEASAKDIINFSGVSPQAVFRQLKKMQIKGQIFKVGKPPKVGYHVYVKNMTNQLPLISNAFNWASAITHSEPPADFYCPSSDVWQGRFSRLAPTLIKKNFDPNVVALVVSAIGEVGDNCFAHNAPGWIDTRGCWFEYEINDSTLRCVIADCGRGILASLRAVRPSLNLAREALLTALTERGVTGRAPEARGNGLKFVMSVMGQLTHGSFSLQSGDARFACVLPLDQTKISEYIIQSLQPIRGTYSEFIIPIPYAS
ncbi:MAG: winged helix-turn-helix transcriptional regulator [Candidatus Magasanikbacteria bacterium]|nr:winged helix-turn-helix transcriptional regulator [Candidatus Magasanikbacteria bacterium]